jgi:hypothetical protein
MQTSIFAVPCSLLDLVLEYVCHPIIMGRFGLARYGSDDRERETTNSTITVAKQKAQ